MLVAFEEMYVKPPFCFSDVQAASHEAKLSPKARGIPDLKERIHRLEKFEQG